jgi:uncharacterized membrane protein (DUF485 family)
MYDIINILQPIGIVLGLLGVFLSLFRGADVVSAVFRGAIVYGIFMILGLIFNSVYVRMVKQALEAEQKKLEAKMLEAKEEIRRKAEERKAAIAAQTRNNE